MCFSAKHYQEEGGDSMKFLRQGEVLDRTGLGRTTVWRKEREGTFPKRRRITGSTIGWLESEIDEWIEARPTVDVGPDEPDPEGS